MAKIIELTGIPGSGKSYIKDVLIHRFNKDNDVLDREHLYIKREEKYCGKKKALFAIKVIISKQFCGLFCQLLINRKHRANRLAKIKYLLKILMQQKFIIEYLKKNKDCTIILDEGFIHVSNIFLDIYPTNSKQWTITARRLLNLVKLYNTSDIFLVNVTSDVDSCVKRIDKRNRWPAIFDGADYGEKVEYLQNYLKSITAQVNFLRNTMIVFDIQNDYSIEGEIDEIKINEIVSFTNTKQAMHYR